MNKIAQLEKLKEHLDEGIIDLADFNKLKAEILSVENNSNESQQKVSSPDTKNYIDKKSNKTLFLVIGVVLLLAVIIFFTKSLNTSKKLESKAPTKDLTNIVSADTVGKFKGTNVLFFETQYGQDDLWAGKVIFFVEKKEILIYMYFTKYGEPKLLKSKVLKNTIEQPYEDWNMSEFSKGKFSIKSDYYNITNDLVFDRGQSTCDLSDIFK